MALSAAIGIEQGPTGAAGVTGATGPAGNTFTTFAVFGTTGQSVFTGATAPASQGSGFMICWNTGLIQPTGVIQWTSVGTAAGWISFSQGGYYNISVDIQPTGVPTLLPWYSQIRFGATGGPIGGINSGSGGNAYIVEKVGLTAAFNEAFAYIPSGGNLEIFNYLSASTGLNVAATGTSLTIFKLI